MADRSDNRRSRITARDRELLGFIAAHRFVFAAHARVFLDASASVTFARLRALERHGLIAHRRRFHELPGEYQITRPWLDLIGSDLPRPQTDVREYKHDIGVAWLWLAARGEAFGEVERIVAERELRSSDARRARGEEPLAVRLGGHGAGGRERLHYPDLLVLGRDGQRTALELELTPKSRTRREGILAGYAVDNRVDRVLYLVESDSIGRAVGTAAQKLGISDLVGIRRVQVTDCQALSRERPGERARAADARAAGARSTAVAEAAL